MDTEIEGMEHDRAQHKQIEDLKIIEVCVVFGAVFLVLCFFVIDTLPRLRFGAAAAWCGPCETRLTVK